MRMLRTPFLSTLLLLPLATVLPAGATPTTPDAAAAQATPAVPAADARAAIESAFPHAVREIDPVVGSNIRRIVMRSELPTQLTWAELDPQDRRRLLDRYDRLAPGDEPPFPQRGLFTLLRQMDLMQRTVPVEGELSVVATVDALGKVERVSVLRSPHPGATRLLAINLMDTPFKPARCAGEPCRMDFPLRLHLVRVDAAPTPR
jgi:hypothetical protein